MTICIGAICSKSVVISADRMVTLQLPPTEFEHTSSKIDTLTDKSLFLAAGQILPATELLRRARAKLATHAITGIEEIAKIVGGVYKEYRSEQIENIWLKPRNLTLDLFYKEGKCLNLPKELALALDGQMIQYNLGVELIIAGVDDAGGHLYSILNPGIYYCHDKIGYVAIGSGAMHAISSFIVNNYSVDFRLNNGAYIAFEAKFTAERAPGVGTETDMVIVSNKGVKFFEQKEIVLLRDACSKIIKPKSAESEAIIKSLPFEKEI